MSDPNVLMGIRAARAGDFNQAATYLAAAVQADPNNEEAWLFFGHCLTDKKKRRFCYERVLELNPSSELAQISLARLDAPPSPGFFVEPQDQVPEETPILATPELDEPAAPPLAPASILDEPEQAQEEPSTAQTWPTAIAESEPSVAVQTAVAQTWPTTLDEPDQPVEEKTLVSAAPARPRAMRNAALQSRKSPLRFLFLIFPLMLLALIGMIVSLFLR